MKAYVKFTFLNRQEKRNNQSTEGQTLLSSLTCTLCTLGGELTACPFSFIHHHSLDYDTLQNPAEGFLSDGNVVVEVDLTYIRVTQKYTAHTRTDDTSLVNLETFGPRAIISRLKKGEEFGLLSKTKIRSSVFTANMLIRHWAELASAILCCYSKLSFICCSEP